MDSNFQFRGRGTKVSIPHMRPQDVHGDGRDWKFETFEHGGDEPDNMPQAIIATDPAGRWAVYVPLIRGGKIVVPCPYSDTVTITDLPQR
jgi:hypothetical protein